MEVASQASKDSQEDQLSSYRLYSVNMMEDAAAEKRQVVDLLTVSLKI